MAKLKDNLYIGESGKTLGDLTNALLTSKSGRTSINITSANGWGLVVLFSVMYGAVLQLQDQNIPNVIPIYGTPDFTLSISNNVITLNNLHDWDHYIYIGSGVISSID